MLSESDSETNDLNTLTINEHFAKAFEYRKEREELAKLKEKYGSDYSDSDDIAGDDSEDSEDTEEDSDGEELTPAVDAAILRTLARIKKKDPAIYQDDRQVFDEEHTRTQDKAPKTRPKAKAKAKSKPLTIREAALASVLADATSHSRSASPEPQPLTHTEEQVLLRSETRAAFHGAVVADVEGDDDDLLIPRARTRDEIELEEEYRTFLEREVGEDLGDLVTVETTEVIDASGDAGIVGEGDKQSDGKKKKKGKQERETEREKEKDKTEVQDTKKARRHDKKAKEGADQEFLMNYIFNRGWIDHSNRRVPTYDEIIESSSKPSKRKSVKSQVESDSAEGDEQNSNDEREEIQGETLSDEDSFDDLADAFETSYNFRFEEPGGALITSYPRNVSSARRESTTRKEARTRKKGRQEAEKQALLESRREEIRRERELAETTVAAEEGDGEDTLKDTSNEKMSKKQKRREELTRLKALKANELRRKLEKVSSEGGLGDIEDEALGHLDLDADWDPSKHDAQMAELYVYDSIADDGDTEKPTWDDDINIDHIDPPTNARSKAEMKKQRKKEKKKKQKAEDGDVGVDMDEMDADLDVGGDWDDDGEEWRGTEEERKRKVDAYMDEVVNRLGFSGITSHMATRFHYTSTIPENYGLAPAEILLATDAELNSYVGLKKLAPYRVDKGGKSKKNWDPKRVERLREFRGSLHARVGSKFEGAWSVDAGRNLRNRDDGAQGEKKRKGRKERAKLKAERGEMDGEDDMDDMGIQRDAEVATKPQKRRRDVDPQSHAPQSDEEKDVDGTQKRKRKRRHKKRFGEGGETDAVVA